MKAVFVMMSLMAVSAYAETPKPKKHIVVVKARTCKIATNKEENKKALHFQKEPLLQCEVKE